MREQLFYESLDWLVFKEWCDDRGYKYSDGQAVSKYCKIKKALNFECFYFL